MYDLELKEMPKPWLISTLENKLKLLSEMMTSESVDLDWFDEVVDLIRRSGETERLTDKVKQLLVSLPVYKISGSRACTLQDLGSGGKVPYLEVKADNREHYEKLGVCLFDEQWVQSYQKLNDLLTPNFSPLSSITNEVVLAQIAKMNESTKSFWKYQPLDTLSFALLVERIKLIAITDI
ncbi:hypothetical protein QYZ43_20200 [Vibrio parahaemolyticus]|nr:hypothetical protein [Vibrio parahaemolyticus]MDN4727545.1 hypothetical protein [Vibrio parahaemolyticus]